MAGEIPASTWEFPEIDRFGPFWSVSGCFGLFWAILGKSPLITALTWSHSCLLCRAGFLPEVYFSFKTCEKKDQKWENSKWARLGPIGPIWARGPYAPVCYAPVSGLLKVITTGRLFVEGICGSAGSPHPLKAQMVTPSPMGIAMYVARNGWHLI